MDNHLTLHWRVEILCWRIGYSTCELIFILITKSVDWKSLFLTWCFVDCKDPTKAWPYKWPSFHYHCVLNVPHEGVWNVLAVISWSCLLTVFSDWYCWWKIGIWKVVSNYKLHDLASVFCYILFRLKWPSLCILLHLV